LLEEAGGPVSLHDGWFIDVGWKAASPDVLITDIACSDMANGILRGNVWNYPALHLRLVYRNAQLLMPSKQEAWTVLRQRDVQILSGEVERVNGNRLEHRLLLWPPESGSFEVRFDDVDVAAVRFDEGDVSLLEPDSFQAPIDRG
jgi:hypothetical protein